MVFVRSFLCFIVLDFVSLLIIVYLPLLLPASLSLSLSSLSFSLFLHVLSSFLCFLMESQPFLRLLPATQILSLCPVCRWNNGHTNSYRYNADARDFVIYTETPAFDVQEQVPRVMWTADRGRFAEAVSPIC